MRGHMRERKPGTWELIVPIGKDALTGVKVRTDMLVTRTDEFSKGRQANQDRPGACSGCGVLI